MLPKDFQNKQMLLNAFCMTLLVFFIVYAMPVYAQVKLPSISAATIIENLSQQLPQLMRLVTAIAYVLGMYFIFVGLLKLKHAGESRTMMSQEHTLKEPLILLAVGAALLYLPTTVQVGMSTFWNEPNPYGYLSSKQQWAQFMNAIYLIIQFIGTIAFIRGLVLLSHLSKGAQQGTFGKGMTHIIAGIFCINIYQFVQVILVTFFGVTSI